MAELDSSLLNQSIIEEDEVNITFTWRERVLTGKEGNVFDRTFYICDKYGNPIKIHAKMHWRNPPKEMLIATQIEDVTFCKPNCSWCSNCLNAMIDTRHGPYSDVSRFPVNRERTFTVEVHFEKEKSAQVELEYSCDDIKEKIELEKVNLKEYANIFSLMGGDPMSKEFVSVFAEEPWRAKIKIVKFTLKIQWKSEKTILLSSHPNAETLIRNLDPMTDDIACLLFDAEDSDFELHGQGHTFPCHKFVLSRRSPYFKAMFEFDPQKTDAKMEDFDVEVYKTLLTFFYHNRIESTKIDCQLLRAANFYLVPELFKICSQYLEENLNVWNVIEIMITADKINGSNNECKFLLDACTKFIKNHCGKLSKPQNWDEDVSSCLLFKALSKALFENDA